jgi:hypothetical protein
MTVQGLIDKLQQMVKDGKAKRKQLVFTDAGDGTVGAVTQIRTGFAYKYTKEQTYGGSNMLFSDRDEEALGETWVHGTKQKGIWITS